MLTSEYQDRLPKDLRGQVLCIGNFDGVHRGHQALFAQARAFAERQNKKLVVLTFEPHPRELLHPDAPPFRLTPPPVKLWRFEKAGVDGVIIAPFNWETASIPAEEFAQNLKDRLDPARIFIGEDFRFGQLRRGTPEMFGDFSIPVTAITKKEDEGARLYSSSRVREKLRQGRISDAANLLGWDWEMRGVIVKGDQRGRTLGFPTANVPIGRTMHPAYGVYATCVKIVEDGPDAPWYMAATNIGIRPMFEIPQGQIEAHILDFDRDIYGCTLRVRPVRFLRGEARFNALEELIDQMTRDCAQTREILNTQP